MSRYRAPSAASAGVAAALAAVAFGAQSGTQIGRVAPIEVALVLGAGLVLAVALPSPGSRRPLYGGMAVLLFALLTVVTGLSMSWSIAPDLTVQELARTFTYLAVFTLGVMAGRRLPGGAQSLLLGLLTVCVAVCGWALATRVWPASLEGDLVGARLASPFDYWNALGGMAALGVPAALWLGARREGGAGARTLACPALAVLVLTILLTQSRGALIAAVLATAVWLVFVPLRLRTVWVIVVGAACSVPVGVWALSQKSFEAGVQDTATREAIATDLGLFVVAMVLVAGALGYAVALVDARRFFSLTVRRRTGMALGAAVAAVAVAGVVGVAVTGGGIGARLHAVTAEQSTSKGAGAARLGEASSSRPAYWRQAVQIFKDAPVTGRGADGFTLARLPYRKDPSGASHAHGFLPQTMADLGLIGLACVLGLFAAWLVAAARTLGVRRRRSAGVEWSGERTVLVALSLSVLAYGTQGMADWTWFIPGPTVAALAAAGFVAGRGPLDALGAVPAERPRAFVPLRQADRLHLIGSAAVVVVALLCSWAVWQPNHSATATDDAVGLATQGKYAAAIRQADDARRIDPYSPDPLFAKATALAGENRRIPAYHTLETAVAEQPRNPETWLRIAQYELALDLPFRALQSTTAALTLDRQSLRVRKAYGQASQAVQAAAGASTLKP